jgi:tetratricopeptide (TPR) repeat protein
MKVLEVNGENEQAWLWLTGTVHTDEERRVCLEGVYFRQFWAYAAAIALLSAMLFIGVISLLTPINLAGLSLEQVDPAIANVTGPLVTGIGIALKLIQAITTVLALAYALFRIAPDFERSQDRQIAAVTKGLSDSGSYHLAARRLAQVGMWASAVLHWQRAAAKEPTQVTYQRHLGLAYAKLGFYERSLDVLQSAHKSANHPTVQAEMKQLIRSVERQVAKLKDDND